MENFRNYYELLGIPREASSDEIKTAYRKLARRYHPDLNPGDKSAEDKFKDIGEAYEVLSDPEKRSQYDQFSKFWKQKGFQGGGRRSTTRKSNEFDFGTYQDFNTFVDQLLNRQAGGTATASRPRPTSRAASRSSPRADRTASRPDPRSPARTPPRSQNYGSDPYRSSSYRSRTGRDSGSSSSRPPRYSSVEARSVEARLTLPLEQAYSGGQERIRLEDGRSLDVSLPPCITSGQRIRLKNQAEDGSDLLLQIEVEPHPLFKLALPDIECRIPITPSEAVLGGAIDVPTLDGWVKMKLPPAVKSGQKLRLAGKGYRLKGAQGDQIVELVIVIPPDLTPQERDAYERLRRVEQFNPRAELPINI